MNISPNATFSVAHPVPEPDFYFVGTNHPRTTFLVNAASARQKRDHVLPALEAFQTAVLDARERVWILDKFFDETHGLPCIWAALEVTNAHDIRILTHQQRPQTLEDVRHGVNARVEWLRVDAQWMHGRFALVDGQLWHFGSTVGGGYPAFDAASCWRQADLVRALEFRFNDAWERRG